MLEKTIKHTTINHKFEKYTNTKNTTSHTVVIKEIVIIYLFLKILICNRS